ncbi:hypothetical protein [Methanobrevibacter olleyae]|uniref:Uncharacterized protein n=1 Tax=Methanobrevibacter olleyae TaxID=294671 RepID=A0A126R205_METOL|nr:hypothetical protein [Methanobrevibacter olleyae]AMK16064.1 hypothetical protein YLM1_1507 [Methanobrevibacter olleyae]
MSNSKNGNLEDVSNGNDESAPRANDSNHNKKTRFNKSKSISEIFKELEFEDSEEDMDSSNSFNNDSSVDEIIPIHNEYKDLEKSDALAEDSLEGGVIINNDSDDSIEANIKKSTETEDYNVDSIEDTDFISDEKHSDEFSEEFIDSIEDMDDEDSLITGKNGDNVLADGNIEEKIGKSSAQGVLINNGNKSSDSDKSLDVLDSSTILTAVGFIVGLGILIIGISYYASSSDRVVDNVLSGETAGLAIFLIIIGLIIIGFSLLKFLSSSRSSLIIDTFNSIKSIDYDEVNEETISRDDFDAIFGILKRKKDSNFSDNDKKDKSVDSSKDLFEKDQEEKVSDDDIDSLYSKSNLTSQKNQSSFKKHENASSTEVSDDNDDEADEIIPIHSKLNEQSDDSTLEDKYLKYDFEDDSSDDFDLVDEDEDGVVDSSDDFDLVDEDEDGVVDSVDGFDLVDEESADIVEEEFEDNIEYNRLEEDYIDDDVNSNLEVEKMDGLEDKYAKYDFDDEPNDVEESGLSKPKFKKSVDLSKFEKEPINDEELAEEKRKAQEILAEKKRRIVESTSFDNNLRKK